MPGAGEPQLNDRFERAWRDARGAEWRAQVDRIALNCGACDMTRYLHIYAPTGERWTFTLAPDASLDGVTDAALEGMVRQRL